MGCRLTNVIAKPVRISLIRAAVLLEETQIPLRGLLSDHRLGPGQHILVSLEAAASVPNGDPHCDPSVGDRGRRRPRRDWRLIFDRDAAARLTRRVTIEAVPLEMFSSPDRPQDRVAASSSPSRTVARFA